MGLDMDDLVSEGNIGLYEAACDLTQRKAQSFLPILRSGSSRESEKL